MDDEQRAIERLSELLHPTFPIDGMPTPWEALPGTVRAPGPRRDAILARDAGFCALTDLELNLEDATSPLSPVIHHLYGPNDERKMSDLITLARIVHTDHTNRLDAFDPDAEEDQARLRALARDRSLDWGEQ